ncbi:MAG: nucleotidyltransferase domain-containing protein [Sedimenticola sp.]
MPERVQMDQLKRLFEEFPELELAVLIGSRATGKSHPGSDWDFAIQWQRTDKPWGWLGDTENLRNRLARQLGVEDDVIDLVDLPTARLAIRDVTVNEGIPLKGDNTLAWRHFLQRTWRDMEDYKWDEIYGTRRVPV